MFYLGCMKAFLLLALLVTGLNSFSQSFFSGRTTGALPFLEYGLGDDRLGGAKMTYLDSNILVKVVDSVNTDYKVQLSNNHFAYLSKQSLRKDTTAIQPYYLSSSWKVW